MRKTQKPEPVYCVEVSPPCPHIFGHAMGERCLKFKKELGLYEHGARRRLPECYKRVKQVVGRVERGW